MGAPCVNDTCSIASRIDPVTRRMEHNVVVSDTGGLECVDGQGLAVKIVGDPVPAAAADLCFQQLGISLLGELWSIPERAKILTFGSSDPAPIPHNGNDSANPINAGSIVNPFSCPALALVLWRLRLGYTVDALVEGATLATQTFGIDWIPFAGQLSVDLLVDGSVQVVSYMDPSGVHPNTAAPHHKRDWREGAWAGVIGAGATWVLTAAARYQVGQGAQVQQFNMDTETAAGSAPAFAERGLKANGQVIIMPFGGE